MIMSALPSHTLSNGAMAGVVIGCVTLIGVVAAVGIIIIKRKHDNDDKGKGTSGMVSSR